MNTRSVLLFILIFFVMVANAQTITPAKKTSFFITAGIGRATFHMNKKNSPDFAQPDIRLGFGFSKPVAKQLNIYSRLNVGYRFANPEKGDGRGGQTHWLYEVAERHHWFFDVPVILNYQFANTGISLGAGALYSMIVKSGSDITLTDNRSDVGIVARGAWKINSTLEVGGEYYFGMIKMLETYPANSPDYLVVRNQFAQVFVNYYLVK